MERRRGILLVLTVVLISWFGPFLNKVSFDPNYSAIDVFSSASEKAKKQKSAKQIEEPWDYTWFDVQLSEEEGYKEEKIVIGDTAYTVIFNENRYIEKNSGKELFLLSNSLSSSYQEAVSHLEAYYSAQGYQVKVESCSETIMISYAHAGCFDVFLLREEAVQ